MAIYRAALFAPTWTGAVGGPEWQVSRINVQVLLVGAQDGLSGRSE